MAGAFRKYKSILFSYVVFWEEGLPNSHQCLSLKGPFLPAASQTDQNQSITNQSVKKTNKQKTIPLTSWCLGFPRSMSASQEALSEGTGLQVHEVLCSKPGTSRAGIQSKLVDLRGLSCVLRFSLASATGWVCNNKHEESRETQEEFLQWT